MLVAFALAVVAGFLAVWTLLAFGDAQVPAGRGWVAGHYYDKSAGQVVESLIGTAALAAAAMTALMLAVSHGCRAVTLRHIPRRWMITLPAIVAVSTFAAAVATTADFCDPSVCRETSGQMH